VRGSVADAAHAVVPEDAELEPVSGARVERVQDALAAGDDREASELDPRALGEDPRDVRELPGVVEAEAAPVPEEVAV
jgi:hypothetical protein